MIETLEQMGIVPHVICGTSMGAVVGAAYAAGRLEALKQWVLELTRMDVVGFFNLKFTRSGFVDPERLHAFLSEVIDPHDKNIEQLGKMFAAVATDLETGNEHWFRHGNVRTAVQASMSIPGLFSPVEHEGSWLVDGGLVNPVPVSVCRAMGADVVLAVNLNGDIVGKHSVKRRHRNNEKPDVDAGGKGVGAEGDNNLVAYVKNTLRAYSDSIFGNLMATHGTPGLFESLAGSINITQDRITRTRLAENPPDIIVAPRLAHIGLLEFYRADEAIAMGSASILNLEKEIEQKLT